MLERDPPLRQSSAAVRPTEKRASAGVGSIFGMGGLQHVTSSHLLYVLYCMIKGYIILCCIILHYTILIYHTIPVLYPHVGLLYYIILQIGIVDCSCNQPTVTTTTASTEMLANLVNVG